jgi:hypothetical protein
MAKTKLPPEVLEFFRRQGAKGGKKGGSLGGKATAAKLTPEQRSARAKKAAAASAKIRAKKADKHRTAAAKHIIHTFL